MAIDSDGIGYMPLNLVDSAVNCLKVKLTTDSTDKEWMPVQFVDSSVQKGFPAYVVDYETPKDYMWVYDYAGTYSESRYYAIFDGSSSYVSIPSYTPAGSFYVSGSFKVSSLSATNTLLSGSTQSTNTFIVDVTTAGAVRFFKYTGGSSSIITSSSGLVTTGTEHTFKAEFDGTTATLTVDGTESGSASWTVGGSEDFAYIGARNGSGSYLTYSIWDVDINNEHFYALDDGYSAASIAADSIGSDDGTYVNFTEDDFVTTL